jgi:hypothetical protein
VEEKEGAVAGRFSLVDYTVHAERRFTAWKAARSIGIAGRDKNGMDQPPLTIRVDSLCIFLLAVY